MFTTSVVEVIGVGLLICMCLVEGGYTPECHFDCSWKNWQNKIQTCSQNNSYGNIKKRSVCPNFFYSSKKDGPANPIQNVTVRPYSAIYTYSDTGKVHDNTFTGLNISFDLDAAGFGFYTGAIIEIIGVKYQAPHFDELGCFYLSFHAALNSSAVMLSNNKTKRMFFDCIRELAPGTTYQITIKMAPFTSNPVIERYNIPSCFHSPKDYYCNTPEEEMPRVWTPNIFAVDVSGDNEAVLTFNLATFDFDRYKVWLQEVKLEHGKQVNLGKQESCVDLDVKNNTVVQSDYCSQQHNFTVSQRNISNTTIVKVTFTGVKSATYIVELLPWPLDDDAQQCLSNGYSTQCTLKSSIPSEVKVHEKVEDQTRPDQTRPDALVHEKVEDYVPDALERKLVEPVKQGSVVFIVVGSFCCVLVTLLLALIVYRSRKNHRQDIYHIDPDITEEDDSIRVKRIFVVHSFDDPNHNNVVLKLCNFLSNFCKFDVHTALWGSGNVVKGVNEWITRECEEADRVIVLCSQGTQMKWRANYRDIPMKTKEEAHGDIFSIFLRVQRVEYEKNPKKFVVAYMSYSCEADIPQPLTFLMKYQLMNHMEQMYYHLNNMKKHSATHDLNAPALQYWATKTAGIDLKKAVDEMKTKKKKVPTATLR